MVLEEENAKYVLWFHASKLQITVQCHFRQCYRRNPPNVKLIKEFYVEIKEYGFYITWVSRRQIPWQMNLEETNIMASTVTRHKSSRFVSGGGT